MMKTAHKGSLFLFPSFHQPRHSDRREESATTI